MDQKVKRNFQHLIKNPPIQQTTYIEPQQLEKNDLNEGWNRVLVHLQNQDYDKAYDEVFSLEDDIYLIRLMSLTGPCINKLSQKIAFQLACKIKVLMKSEFWKVLGVRILSQMSSKQDSLKIEQRQKIQHLLFQWSKSWQPQVSKETALLYNSGIFRPEHIL